MKIYVIYNAETREIYSLNTSKFKTLIHRDMLAEELFPDTPLVGVYNTNTQSIDSNIWDNVELLEDDNNL